MGTLKQKMLRNHFARVAATGMWLIAAAPLARAADTNAPATPAPTTNAPAAASVADTNATAAIATNAPAEVSAKEAAAKDAPVKPAVAVAAKSATIATTPPVLPSKNDYTAFKVIGDRNIFNPNRTSRSAAPVVVAEKPKVVKVEAFALLGTMSSEKGSVAFFDGSSSSFRKALKPADTIANYKLKEIAANGVKLESGGKEVELRVGMQLRRQDEGEWQLGGKSESYGGSGGSTSSSSSSSTRSRSSEGGAADASPATAGTDAGAGDGASDLLKRLMEKRAKEIKK